MFCYDTEKKKFHLFHTWSKWKLGTQIIHVGWGYNKDYEVTIQTRSCIRCYKMELRTVS